MQFTGTQIFKYYLMVFSFDRETLVKQIQDLNCQKSSIKRHGVIVDGKKYQIKFTGITCSNIATISVK